MVTGCAHLEDIADITSELLRALTSGAVADENAAELASTNIQAIAQVHKSSLAMLLRCLLHQKEFSGQSATVRTGPNSTVVLPPGTLQANGPTPNITNVDLSDASVRSIAFTHSHTLVRKAAIASLSLNIIQFADTWSSCRGGVGIVIIEERNSSGGRFIWSILLVLGAVVG